MKSKRKLLFILISLIAAQAEVAAEDIMNDQNQKATFAGGCFWGIEKYFGKEEGVVSTRVGYTGGSTPNPSYEEVCTGNTGHAEATEVIYDPNRTNYQKLVEFFFTHHDPTQLNRQGNDIGTQYRSAIFYHSPVQQELALKAVDHLNQSGIFKSPVVTQISPAGDFWAAEAYHQKYLEKNPFGYCHIQKQPRKVLEVLKQAWKKEGIQS